MLPLAHYLPEFDADDGMPFESLAPVNRSSKPTFEHPILVASRDVETGTAVPVISSPIPEIVEVDEVDELVLPEAGMPDLTGEAHWPATDMPESLDFGDGTDALPDLDADVDGAEEPDDGRLALQAEMDAAIEAARAEERELAEAAQSAAIEAARAEWATAEGERLATLLSGRLDRIEMVVRTTLASVLRPIAVNTRRRQSVLELADATRMLIGDGKALSVRATGPADLLTALDEALGTGRDFVTWQSDETLVDVRIECDQTVIESRLHGWRAALEEALA
ncbi:hypothetical protein [Aurantimonas sp. A3-2-R12]|uniref:hypothetical protein n=1 Tax=Aurantimonas sp. A3-2-R12 TaxID=3114362 RepID=UPI002E19BA90|nr:hypothetical protein [Aurantimonas sp. A3-2-R12]